MKKIFNISVVIVIALSLLTACEQKNEINRKLLPMSTGGGISYGLYNTDGEIETEKHFEINTKTNLEKILSFGNLIEVDREYKLLIFANYEQIEFSVDNENSSFFHDFNAKANEHLQRTITLPKLSDGFYDLLFLIIKDPNNISLDEDYRKRTDMSHLISMRYSLQVGDCDTVNPEPIVSAFEESDNEILDGVFLNQSSNELNRLLTTECKLNEIPKFFVHLGNKSPSSKKYIVLLLCDWKQIPIENNKFVYCSVPSTSRVSIPVEVSNLKDIGVHNFTAISIEEPFKAVSMDSRSADISIRVGINLKC